MMFEFDVKILTVNPARKDYSIGENYMPEFEPRGDLFQIKYFAMDKDQVVAYGSASIYSIGEDLNRGCGCSISSNKRRSLWIDCIKSFQPRKGYGTLILNMLESHLAKKIREMCPKSKANMYLITKYENHAFYAKNGYDEIDVTFERDEEDDYNYFKEELNIYAKPLEKILDDEKYVFDLIALTSGLNSEKVHDVFHQAIFSKRRELNLISLNRLAQLYENHFDKCSIDMDETEIRRSSIEGVFDKYKENELLKKFVSV